MFVSGLAHLVAAAGTLAGALVLGGAPLPEVRTIAAFVAWAPPPTVPPPPALVAVARPVRRSAPASEAAAVPLSEPESMVAEALDVPDDERPDDGLGGGETGASAGGTTDGVAGGLIQRVWNDVPPPVAPLPPAPSPPPPEATGPVRIGGDVQPPVLVRRVDPEYPALAAEARLEGLVLLEAVVGEDGTVESLSVVRHLNLLLDRAAAAAVRQWRYAPLRLNGRPVRFILTVTVSFRLPEIQS